MERIGLAASKMAKGNLVTYNIFVVAISCLCSLFIFLVCGLTVFAALFLIFLILRAFMPSEFGFAWFSIIKLCMVGLAVVVGIFNIAAIIKNLKLTKKKV